MTRSAREISLDNTMTTILLIVNTKCYKILWWSSMWIGNLIILGKLLNVLIVSTIEINKLANVYGFALVIYFYDV